MALPNAKSPWRRVKKCGTAARTNATRKPAGKRAQFSGATLRKVAGAALRYLKSRSIKNFALLGREDAANADTAQAVAEGFITANFETDKYKTEKKNGKEIDAVRIAGYSESEKSAGEKGLATGKIIAEAQNFAL